MSFKIGENTIGKSHPVYLIAEMSANHGQDLGKARDLVYAAKESGANAIKLQTYRADTLTLDCKTSQFYIADGPWKGQYMYDLYSQGMMPWEWHEELMDLSASIGLTCFSSPFDLSAIDLLESLDVPAYKIASPEIIDIALIRRVASTGKPLIISTGGATLSEIEYAVKVASDEGAENICLLKCTSAYPAPPEAINLNTIPHMEKCFGKPVGLSDHTLGVAVPIASVAVGAVMIEKHLVLDRNDKTIDAFFSLTPQEFKLMRDSVRVAELAMGSVSYPMERSFSRRSLYAKVDISKGEFFSGRNVGNFRPGGGILPVEFAAIEGRKARMYIARGEPLTWELVGDL